MSFIDTYTIKGSEVRRDDLRTDERHEQSQITNPGRFTSIKVVGLTVSWVVLGLMRVPQAILIEFKW